MGILSILNFHPSGQEISTNNPLLNLLSSTQTNSQDNTFAKNIAQCILHYQTANEGLKQEKLKSLTDIGENLISQLQSLFPGLIEKACQYTCGENPSLSTGQESQIQQIVTSMLPKIQNLPCRFFTNNF